MAKNLEIAGLLDCYGEMLTQKQHDFLDYYYNEDLSLSEIAANEGITRQGVRDAIKRAETQLFEMESKLGLVRRFEEIKQGLNEIAEYADLINAYNLRHSLSREVNEYSVKIKAVSQILLDK
ncbi:MAG: DNA-binding protein [Clostridia bacterium]|nr:DNA-binding protein [Clostridia bacterium]